MIEIYGYEKNSLSFSGNIYVYHACGLRQQRKSPLERPLNAYLEDLRKRAVRLLQRHLPEVAATPSRVRHHGR